MQNQLTLAMANYNVVQAGGTVLTYQQQNQQNILAAIAAGAPQGRLNALAYLQENGLPIPTSAFDDFFASQEGLDYALTNMTDLDDLTNALVAMGWLKNKNQVLATNLDDLKVQLLAAGIGGAPTESHYELTSEQKEHSLDDILGLFQSTYASQFPNGALLAKEGMWVSTETMIGRIFAVLKSELRSRQGEDLDRLCAKAEVVLGIPAQDLKNASTTRKDDRFADNLVQLFTNAHLGGIFVSSQPLPHIDTQKEANILSFEKIGDGSTYRLRFDTNLPSSYGVASVYVLDDHEKQISDTAVYVRSSVEGSTQSIHGTLFVDIPSSALRGYIITQTLDPNANASIGYDSYRARLSLKLAVWQSNDVMQPGIQGHIKTNPMPFSVPMNNPEVISIEDLSILPVGNPNREIENFILSQIKTQSPLDRMEERTWGLGSPYHNGEDYDAADINRGAGTTDLGDDIYSVGLNSQEGTFVLAKSDNYSNDYGVIRIEYTSVINGQNIRWYVEYLHTLTRKTGTDANGKSIFTAFDSTGEKIMDFVPDVTKVKGHIHIADVGGRGEGKDNDFSPHMHQRIVFIDPQTGKESEIDMRNLLAKSVLAVTATDGGIDGRYNLSAEEKEFYVIWDAGLNAWITGDIQPKDQANPHLIYDRTDQVFEDGDQVYWLAYSEDPHERKRVVWGLIDPMQHRSGWLLWDEQTNNFAQESGQRQEWIPSSRSWQLVD